METRSTWLDLLSKYSLLHGAQIQYCTTSPTYNVPFQHIFVCVNVGLLDTSTCSRGIVLVESGNDVINASTRRLIV